EGKKGQVRKPALQEGRREEEPYFVGTDAGGVTAAGFTTAFAAGGTGLVGTCGVKGTTDFTASVVVFVALLSAAFTADFAASFVAAGTGFVGILGVAGTTDFTASVVVFVALFSAAFTVDFAASDTVAAGWFCAVCMDLVSLMLVGAGFTASGLVEGVD